MKFLGALMLSSVMLTSCGGGSIESDAKKVADLQCKAQQLAKKATSGDMSIMEESTKLATEIAALKEEIEGKYTSDDDQKKFLEALSKAMADCD